MTTPEHALIGIHVAFALGCHRCFGWASVAMAGVASIVPDWDGLAMLVNMQRFEAGHRVIGHNVFLVAVCALSLGWTEGRFRWIERIGSLVQRKFWRMKVDPANLSPRFSVAASTIIFACVALVAQLLHLACDIMVSGGNDLPDWRIRPFWPMSNTGYVFPLIPWGDIGPTVILMLGIICAAKRPRYVSTISGCTLVVLVVYMVVRGWFRGTL